MTVGVFQPRTVVRAEVTPSTALPTTTDYYSRNTGDLSNTDDPRASIGTNSVEENSTAIALGGVAAILLLVLVGVVLRWMWTCHKIKGS